MISSAEDMSRWMHFLLKPTRNLEEIINEVMAPSAIVRDDPKIWTNEFVRPDADESHIYDKYGLGWFLGSYRCKSMNFANFV